MNSKNVIFYFFLNEELRKSFTFLSFSFLFFFFCQQWIRLVTIFRMFYTRENLQKIMPIFEKFIFLSKKKSTLFQKYIFRLNIHGKTGQINLSVNKSYIENVKYRHYDENSSKIPWIRNFAFINISNRYCLIIMTMRNNWIINCSKLYLSLK